MQFINPRTDFAFKKIFGSDRSHEILLSFLNAVLGLKAPYAIETLKILDPYQAPSIKGMKDTYVDVRAIDGTGRQFIVEMQVLNVQGMEQRVLYNACKAYVGQIQTGEDYTALCDVIALTITDFAMFPGRDEVVSKFKLRAEDGNIYSDDLEMVFVELPKFTKQEAELMDVQDKWLYFMRRAKDLSVVPQVLQQEPQIAKAFDIANRANLNKAEEEAQTKREIFIQDMRGAAQIREEGRMLAEQGRRWTEEGMRAVEEGKRSAEEGKRSAEEGKRSAEEGKRSAEEGKRSAEEGKRLVEEGKRLADHAHQHEAQTRAEGQAAGERTTALRIARSMLALIADDAAIAAATGLAVSDVAALRGHQNT